MLSIATTLHDPCALVQTCQRRNMTPPSEETILINGQTIHGWIITLPGLSYPIVCDTLRGVIAYHPRDNGHVAYGRIMRFIYHAYDNQARLRQQGSAEVKRMPVMSMAG